MAIWGKLTAEPAKPAATTVTADAPGASTTTTTAGGNADKSLPDPTALAGLAAVLMFGLAAALALALNDWAHATPKPFLPSSDKTANFALLAGFYVAAQVIERLMEFVAPVLPPMTPAAWLQRAMSDTNYTKIANDDAAKAAQIKADRAKLALGVAAVLGVAASCLFGLFFLAAIGMHVSHTVDAILTGITIAAGTKPLHDFITSLQNNNSPTTGTGTSADGGGTK